jgi:cytochrome P450
MSRTPPGPDGEPVLGAGRQYADDPFAFLAACERSYGDVAGFDLGPFPTYLVSDPGAIERVLVSDADDFRKPRFGDDAIYDLLGDGLLLSNGDAWREGRDLATPAFRMSRLSGFADRIADHAAGAIADWEPGETRNVEIDMTDVTLDVILDLMMGVQLDDDRVETIREALEPVGARFEPNPLQFVAPDWAPLPGDREFREGVETLEAILDDIVAARRGTEGDAVIDDGPTDFLSILLRARDRGDQTDAQVRDELMTTLLAGHDTTALTLTYTWYLLSGDPEVERRLHEEVDAVLGGRDRPTMDDVGVLDYVERVIKEAMRLYPPVYVLFREPTTDVDLAGYTIPEGTTIALSQWAVHRSPRFWDDPEAFDPDRWTPERRAARPRFAYFPFGGGPRHCIGKHLAMLEAQSIVATTARRYRLAYAGDEPIDLRPSLTMHPQDGMPMRVIEREDAPPIDP